MHFSVMVIGENHDSEIRKFSEYSGCENPKFDTCCIGGRYDGFFKHTAHNFHEAVEHSYDPDKKFYVNQLRKRNLDWAGLLGDEIKERLHIYDSIVKVIDDWLDANPVNGERYVPKPLSYYEELCNSKDHPKITPGMLRDTNEGYIATLRTAGLRWHYNFCPIEEYYSVPRGLFAMKISKLLMVPYDYLLDGKWGLSNTLGWNATLEQQYELAGKFWEMYNTLQDDTLLTIYDCHS